MLYWSLCEETVCFEASVSETLWFSMSFQRKCLETKRITSVTVIYWTLQPGCRRFWSSPFVSLGTFWLCHNLLCSHMPFSGVWDQMLLVLGECEQLSVMQKIAPLLVQPWHIQRVLLWLFTCIRSVEQHRTCRVCSHPGSAGSYLGIK